MRAAEPPLSECANHSSWTKIDAALWLAGTWLSVALFAGAAVTPARAAEGPVRAVQDPASGQIDVRDGTQPILRYNYRTVEPPPGFMEKVSAGNRKYARARSDYIHPLYGPDGEVLTHDWSPDHPHHRGVYWAWPEVDYHGPRGDLHALQRVSARPTGQIKLNNQPDWAEIEAHNRWMWDDRTPIIEETAVIRVHKADERGRAIDLRLTFAAIDDPVSVARRGTTGYGGLNLRFSPVQQLELVKHTDPDGAQPRRAWADAVGVRQGGRGPTGVAILPRQTNAGYPDDWVDFAYLPWLQPAFPRANWRVYIHLRKDAASDEPAEDAPLVLEYRLWVHRGGRLSDAEYAAQWLRYNPAESP